MRAVSNTSPISNLAIIGKLDLLQRRYSEVRIPPAVATELARLTHPGGKRLIDSALAQGWLSIDRRRLEPILTDPLDQGELAAITLALASQPAVLLIDEKLGRAAARKFSIPVGGVLGELLHAKLRGWLPSLRVEMEHLRRNAHFFIDAEIEDFILSQAGE